MTPLPILGAEVLVEVDFGVGYDVEVGLDDDGWLGVLVVVWAEESFSERTFELLGGQVKPEIERSGVVTHGAGLVERYSGAVGQGELISK